MASDEPTRSAIVATELRACAARHHAQIDAALAMGKDVPLARPRLWDEVALDVVDEDGVAGPTAEPPLLPGPHKAR